MRHDWMIRMLEELRRYARAQGLPALAEHLDQACLLAQAEIANRAADAPDPSRDPH